MPGRRTLPLATLLVSCAALAAQAPPDLRSPSVPLVVHDPYFSIWLPHDSPTAGWPTHWTGRTWPISSTVTIDGTQLRLLGLEPAGAAAMPCARTEVTPTRTTFHYANDTVALDLAFFTPALPDDLDVLSRPLTYVVWEAKSTDGKPHALEVTLQVTPLVCVDKKEQAVAKAPLEAEGLDVAGVGSKAQEVLGTRGDDLRIDWGYAYLALARGAGSVGNAADHGPMLRAKLRLPAQESARQLALFAYDDLLAIRYFDADLPAYWRRKPGASAATLLRDALADFTRLDAAGKAFDRELCAAAATLGGAQYAQLCTLAYRQCLGANKLCADGKGQPLLFPKENFSNGCIATVDVIYPMAPLFLLLGADLTKAMLEPVLAYGSSSRWKFPFAPHDLGTYPHATGQVYGGGERDESNQMPVEESADLLLLVAALAQREGNADYALRFWPALAKWAAYLESKGFDPERQLCTDDFTGHLAHNVNLSAKAILGLGAFAKLCTLAKRPQDSERWRAVAAKFVAQWLAKCGDQAPTPLAFDKPGTWSQKYNLVWDSILGLNLFPPEVVTKELAAYRERQNRYGLPLDSRAKFTKIDWTLWSACLTGKREDFDALVAPVWRWANETPDRVPMTDWYDTQTGKKVGFVARSVVGGLFVRFLQDGALWRTWFEKGPRAARDWAPLALAEARPLVETAAAGPVEWQYTTAKPADGWHEEGFDAAAWDKGPAGFGTKGTPGAIVRTEWKSRDIWLRRTFTLEEVPADRVQLLLHHDEDAEVWINGLPAARVRGYSRDYERVAILPAALQALRAGVNTLAIHCRQTTGGQYVDAGLVTVQRAR